MSLEGIPVPARPVLLWVSLATCWSPDSMCRSLTCMLRLLLQGAASISATWARATLGRGLASADGNGMSSTSWGPRPPHCRGLENKCPWASAWHGARSQGRYQGRETATHRNLVGIRQTGRCLRVEAGRGKCACGRSVSQGSSWAVAPREGHLEGPGGADEMVGGYRMVLAA